MESERGGSMKVSYYGREVEIELPTSREEWNTVTDLGAIGMNQQRLEAIYTAGARAAIKAMERTRGRSREDALILSGEYENQEVSKERALQNEKENSDL